MKPTHCVIMVTYNHEKYIREALNSVFDNDILPDKVILFDDCSTDLTWSIVCEFAKKYENILECHRNAENLGIFKNINQAYNAAIHSGCDIITDLAGDDYLKKELFKELNRVVEQNNIDVKNDKFIIVTNTEELYPNGDIRVFDNYHLRNEHDLTYYRLTGKLSYREVGLSRNILDGIELYRDDLGVWADLLVCLNYETNCDKFYFSPFVSAGYRVGVGTVSKQKQDAVKKSRYIVEKIVLRNYTLSRKSKVYLKRSILKYEYELERCKYDNNQRTIFPFILCIRFHGVKTCLRKTAKKILQKLRLIKG